MGKHTVWLRRFQCTECGTIVVAPKNANSLNKQEHIKDMWCYQCRKTTKFEMKDYGDLYHR